MKKGQYKEILEHHTRPSRIELIGSEFNFQLHSDPKQISKLRRDYLQYRETLEALRNVSTRSRLI